MFVGIYVKNIYIYIYTFVFLQGSSTQELRGAIWGKTLWASRGICAKCATRACPCGVSVRSLPNAIGMAWTSF